MIEMFILVCGAVHGAAGSGDAGQAGRVQGIPSRAGDLWRHQEVQADFHHEC